MQEPHPHPEGGCCSPSQGASRGVREPGAAAFRTAPTSTSGMVSLPGGVFVIGSSDRFAYTDDGETPREVEINALAACFSACAVDTLYSDEATKLPGVGRL